MKTKTAVISGITGQDAVLLASLLLSKGYIVVGIKRKTSTSNMQRLQYLNHSNLIIENGDITDANSINHIVDKYKPDEFYGLAAISHVGYSFEAPYVTSTTNCMGTLNCLEAIKNINPSTKFLMAASSEMYGNYITNNQHNDDIILNEESPLSARSPYGATKIYGYNLTKNYRESYDLFACNSISFNHESPLRGEHFVTRKITKGIADIIKMKSSYITLGNIESKRDWSFAGDIVYGMYLMMQHNEPDDFVIASGQASSVKDFLKAAFKAAGIDDYTSYVKIDDKFFRPSDIDCLLGDSTKIRNTLGWKPYFNFNQLVEMMVKFDFSDDEAEKRQLINDALVNPVYGGENG